MAHLSEGGIRVPSMNNAHRARPEGLPQVRYRQDFKNEAIAGAWEKDLRRAPKQGGGVKKLPWRAVSARGRGANPIRCAQLTGGCDHRSLHLLARDPTLSRSSDHSPSHIMCHCKSSSILLRARNRIHSLTAGP